MMHLVTGGSGSGKSEYAESLIQKAGAGRRIYLATMIPYGEEGRQRVSRHRQLRKEKQFETVECYTGLQNLSLPKDALVLLECMSNLTANEMFEPGGAGEKAADVILQGAEKLAWQVRELVIVTNEIFSDGNSYEKETQKYLAALGEVNRRLARMADTVTEVVCGIPISISV